MSIEESKQRVVDRFWGLPTEVEKNMRLEEIRRRIFETRVRRERKVMIATGSIRA